MIDNLTSHVEDYHQCFLNETSDGHELCKYYINGLIKTEHNKRNIERINEEIEMSGDSYQKVQQFITDSPWSSEKVIGLIAQNTSDLYAGQPDYCYSDVGYIIDESAHLKKGDHSVGVARQYAGVVGKVDNCQVGVYSSLVWKCHSTLIDCRLYIPESWTKDKDRCEKAGMPLEARIFKTKQELALDMIKAAMFSGIDFGWVGGDGFYGHGQKLSNNIENMGLQFLLDVHSNQMIYKFKPEFSVSEKENEADQKPKKIQTDVDPITVKKYASQLTSFEWRRITVRDATKGPLTLSVHAKRVWILDEENNCFKERTLVISRNLSDNKIKYSLSNMDLSKTRIERLAYMQAQRYWVERAFQEAKSELGMSDYQIRKWNGWHHHMALVMMALSFIVKERIKNKIEYPLLSCRDVRLMIIALLIKDENLIEKRISQMEYRHKQRCKDIERQHRVAESG